jgi:hypothetical protein
MKTVLRSTVGLLVGLGLSLSLVLPAAAEPGGGKAAIILERIEAQITYQTLVLQATKAELIAYGAAVRENNK